MTIEIKDVQTFIRAAQSEFYQTHPDILNQWHYFLGRKIESVKQGNINETEYIEQWGRPGI
jgi:hypothetical protein